MKLKKIQALMLAGALLAGSGCTKTKQTDNDELVEVTWYMMKANDNMSSQELVEKEVNKILEKEIGVRLKLKLIETGAWDEKMNMILTSGEDFDICMTSHTGPTSIITNVKRDAFLDLTDLIEQYAPDIKKKLSQKAWHSVTFDGKIMAIPSQAKYVPDSEYVFKKDLVEKYGFDYQNVKSMKDLIPYCETILANETGVIPLDASVSEPATKDYTETVVSGIMFDENAEKFVREVDVRKEEYRLKHDFYLKGYIPKDAFTKEQGSEQKSGKYAVLPTIGAYTEDGSKATAYYGFPCVEVLTGQGRIPPQNMMSGNAISVNCKHPEKVVQMLNLIWKESYLSNTLAYGLEGVNYTVTSGTTDEDKHVEPQSGSASTWTLWHNWIGPLFDQWDSPWNSREALKKMEEDNENGIESKTCGFMMDIEPVETEIAALSEVVKSSSKVLSNGNMDDFDTYFQDVEKKLTEAGIDDILSEFNRQYDEWKASSK